MVQIYKPAKGKKKQPQQKLKIEIDSLDHEGTGICRQHQPVIFVEGALPGELCQVQVTEKKPRYWRAIVNEVLSPNPQRVDAFCQYYQQCGGCNNQQITAQELLSHKQSALSELLKRVGQQQSLPWLPPVLSPAQGYRRKARLAVDAQDKSNIKLGFRSAQGRKIVNIEHCPVLTENLQALLPALNQVFKQLKKSSHIGHVLLLDVLPQPMLLFRQVKTIADTDLKLLSEFCQQHACRMVLETAKNTFQLISGATIESFYQLDEDLRLHFLPNDFIQGNELVNQKMVQQAVQWLELTPRDIVLDLFCGIGNFSLAMAKHCQSVLGIEGVDTMVNRATENARKNDINNAQFAHMDLNQEKSLANTSLKNCNKVLLDPARAGALEVMPQLLKLKPEAILYISCNPATFARDAAVLTGKSYRLAKIAVLDMFPATSHTELMALFLPV